MAQAERAEDHAIVATLTRAFFDDPLFNFFTPDLVRQMRGLLAFMGAAYVDARPFGNVWVAHTNDAKVAGAAVWLPPGAYPRNSRREAMTYLRGLPSFARVGRRLAATVRLLNELDKAHHDATGPHFYLEILGVDPLYQRTGAGSAVLQPVLEQCDTEGLGAYLETQKPENVPWYGRHGFDLVQEMDIQDCPPIWTMLRQPRA
ncbi:MAG: acetyltransferase family protein [Actinomycetia bacterium]|nr:acetyltransferase family protein [Actinomycetes bacterium]